MIDYLQEGVEADLDVTLRDLTGRDFWRKIEKLNGRKNGVSNGVYFAGDHEVIELVGFENDAQRVESLTKLPGAKKLHISMWHMNAEEMLRYVRPTLDRWNADLDSKQKVVRQIRRAVDRCEICRTANTRLAGQPKRLGRSLTCPMNGQWLT